MDSFTHPALGHVLMFVRVVVVEGSEDAPVQVGRVAVPRRAVHVRPGPVDHGARVAGDVGVVVVGPDPGVEARVPQRRPDVLLRHPRRLVRGLVHGDVPAALAVQGLVLERDGVDGGAVVLECLQVLHEVLRICRVVLRVERVVVPVACEGLVWWINVRINNVCHATTTITFPFPSSPPSPLFLSDSSSWG